MLSSEGEYSGAAVENEVIGVTGGDQIRTLEAKRKPAALRGNRTPERALFQVPHEIFEEQADARPDAVAVVFDRERVTYAALEQSANRIVRHLRARGVRRGSRAAMQLPRSVDALR